MSLTRNSGGFALRSEQSIISISKMKLSTVTKMQKSACGGQLELTGFFFFSLRRSAFILIRSGTRGEKEYWGFPFGTNWLWNDFWRTAFWVTSFTQHTKWKRVYSQIPLQKPMLWCMEWLRILLCCRNQMSIFADESDCTFPLILQWLTILSVSLSWVILRF